MSEAQIENVVIIGSGPAGLTAALYTARANMNPLVLEGTQPGGQLTITTDVENFPGFPEGVMGPELMDRMRQQVERFGTRFEFETIDRVDFSGWPHKLYAGDREIVAKTVIIATGASARYLGLANERRLQLSGGGVSACATCDGFFYQGVEIAVVGGGDSAAEEASFLTKFASKVHLIVRRDTLRASKAMQKRVFENSKIEVHWFTEVDDLIGTDKLTAALIRDNQTGETRELPIEGFFLAIGHTPNTAAFVDWIDHDGTGYLVTQPNSMSTNVPGVFACGDAQDSVYRQAISAAGTGCMAALEAERWLESREAGE